MSDYMQKKNRLAKEYALAVRDGRDDDCREIYAALLAHIKRGRVPEEARKDVDEAVSEVMEQAQVFASAWSLIGGVFDGGNALQDAEEAKSELEEMVRSLATLAAPAARSAYMHTDVACAPSDQKQVPVYCTPTEHEGRIVYEHTSEPIPNSDGFVLYAAPAAPDHSATVPATLDEQAVYARIAAQYFADTAPAEVPMPKPVAFGVLNTALTGSPHRLMMVRIDIPSDDQYGGALWMPLVFAEDAQKYGDVREAVGKRAGLAEAGRRISLWLKDPDVQRMLEFARDASRKVTSWPGRLVGSAQKGGE